MPSVNESSPTGKQYWRSFDDRADTPEFRRYVEKEFPYLETDGTNGVNRRQFLTLMSASMALGGLTACRRPAETIVPYVKPPEEVIPGVPLHYATTMPLGEQVFPLVVESHEGRPTKIEGNDKHPASRGVATAFPQAELLNLYDPHRSPRVLKQGQPMTWADFVTAFTAERTTLAAAQGKGLAILSEAASSPTYARLAAELRQALPQATWTTWEPISSEHVRQGVKIATGAALRPVYEFAFASCILALDCDFLFSEPDSIRHARGYAKRRNVAESGEAPNRLYAVESYYSLTGAAADHRLRLPASRIGAITVALAKELGVKAAAGLQVSGAGLDAKFIAAVAHDLLAHKGQCLVVAGQRQSPAVHALVLAINEALGNLGKTMSLVTPRDTLVSSSEELATLAKAMAAGAVSHLVILGGNPVYQAPVELGFAAALAKVPFAVHLSAFADETSQRCAWHLPATHFLEQWGDAASYLGVLSLIQPLIAPLYPDAHSSLELLNLIVTGAEAKGYDLVRTTWQTLLPKADFESQWRVVLHDGVRPTTAYKPLSPAIDQAAVAAAGTVLGAAQPAGYEVLLQPSSSVYDGRYANNGWLQETPDPVTKITWDNAAIVSPATAKVLGVDRGFERLGVLEYDVLAITVGDQTVELPAYVLPGHADNCITIALGYGRDQVGPVADKVGANSFVLRRGATPDIVPGAQVRKTGAAHMLAQVQDHHSMEDRPLVRENTFSGFKDNHELKPAPHEMPLKPLWAQHKYDAGYQWGMAIDLNTCIGFNACQVACQSENNIPVIGKTQVSKGREMHWIRIDRYFNGNLDSPRMVSQPLPCQHCENAPCEQVCPVTATTHDREGLNVMVYNRCIGTRYCSNNCPYKVRRFNYFNYTKDTPVTTQMAMNPDVTVRFRGVMEKCTYCTQRINEAKFVAKREERTVADGEIRTACQQACPVGAITFGNVNDPNSRVSKLKALPRNYTILTELFTQPRTSYLGRLRNPNPALEPVAETTTPDHATHDEHKDI